MARYGGLILIAAFLLAAGTGLADPAAPPDGPQAKTKAAAVKMDDATRAAKLAECMRQIRDAKDPAEALTAYARGCSIAPQDPRVRDAHMRRMLQFGKPNIATAPAKVLVKLQPENALAHAVVGYWHCKRKEWGKALEETVLALAGMDRDGGVLNNAGQLVAWREAQTPQPKLSERADRILSEKRSRLMNQSRFANAHEKVRAFFERRAAIGREFDEKIAKVEGELDKLRTVLRDTDSRIASLKHRVKEQKREMYRLKRSLPDRRDRDERDRRRDRRDEDRIRDQIHEYERQIDRLEAAIKQEFRSGAPKLKEYRGKQAAVKKLKADKAKAMGGLERVLRWEPPGVDGVATAESDAPLSSSGRKDPPKDVDRKPGAEGDAERLLKLAKSYRAMKRDSRALTLLQQIISKYPGTAAGKEAIKLIQAMVKE